MDFNKVIAWSPGVSLADVEKQVIQKAVQFYKGDKLTTSNALKIDMSALDSKLKQYDNEAQEQEKKQEALRAKQAEFQARARGVACAQPNGQPLQSKTTPVKETLPRRVRIPK